MNGYLYLFQKRQQTTMFPKIEHKFFIFTIFCISIQWLESSVVTVSANLLQDVPKINHPKFYIPQLKNRRTLQNATSNTETRKLSEQVISLEVVPNQYIICYHDHVEDIVSNATERIRLVMANEEEGGDEKNSSPVSSPLIRHQYNIKGIGSLVNAVLVSNLSQTMLQQFLDDEHVKRIEMVS